MYPCPAAHIHERTPWIKHADLTGDCPSSPLYSEEKVLTLVAHMKMLQDLGAPVQLERDRLSSITLGKRLEIFKETSLGSVCLQESRADEVGVFLG